MTPSALKVKAYLNARAELYGPDKNGSIHGIAADGVHHVLSVADLEVVLTQHAEMLAVLRIIVDTAADELSYVEPQES